MKKFLLLCLLVTFNCALLFPQSNDILKYDVKARIDSVWGPGYAAEEQLRIFDSVWTLIDQKYACFQNLDLDWNAVKEKYRPEIAQGVSRGRFGAIINHMGISLKEPHTTLFDTLVSNNMRPPPGVPLIFSGYSWRFGAGLTPLSDSSVLVTRVVNQHPLNISPGDIVLGYDGIPWKKLYQKLLDIELPIYAWSYTGANEKAFTHAWLQGVGNNWHLFDTIDIMKYPSGDTLHLPTHLLASVDSMTKFTEQIPVPGISFPDNPGEPETSVRWGIVQGTTIGYIYVWSWLHNSVGRDFSNAIDSLITIYHVNGLILDFRANHGGYVSKSEFGLRLLFNTTPPAIFLYKRNDPLDHFAMRPYAEFRIYQDSIHFFDKPIAVLTGPHCASACDFISMQLKYHPYARFFGLTNASAYASPEAEWLDSGIVVQFGFLNGFLDESPPRYLTHEEFQVDEKVWHTQEAVAKGEDNVVNVALAWIKSVTGVVVDNAPLVPENFTLKQNYPNPFNPVTTIAYQLPTNAHITLTVFDAIGRQIKIIVNEEKPAGNYSLKFDASGLSSGVYFYSLRAPNFASVKKMVVMK